MFKITRFFKIMGFFTSMTSLEKSFSKSPNFTNPEFCMDKSRILHGQIPNVARTNPEFCMDKSRILHGQIPNVARTNPEFCMDKSRILHGQIPNFGQIPDISHFYRIPCIFQNFRVFKKFPVQSSFRIPRLTTYKKSRFSVQNLGFRL